MSNTDPRSRSRIPPALFNNSFIIIIIIIIITTLNILSAPQAKSSPALARPNPTNQPIPPSPPPPLPPPPPSHPPPPATRTVSSRRLSHLPPHPIPYIPHATARPNTKPNLHNPLLHNPSHHQLPSHHHSHHHTPAHKPFPPHSIHSNIHTIQAQ
ncbi:uncharacterized protein K452DRAFT_118097 [Aplosporella prunicola CBS 121167]|uniref:Uncharacterized protein n=1 Tax=Aplosporella prunicola CBS 121167 TaxID=1176127 RepID=A0A6A6AZT1_9PEZI|nr:uncharacterized protein K452DRAFT_118097 [Aplosporella prunicola CBS 121167]KAF2136778.1 hypothetical protein K452DRAFT_118097 [Aplosporella prunicola CBS 121167]